MNLADYLENWKLDYAPFPNIEESKLSETSQYLNLKYSLIICMFLNYANI